MGSSGLFEDPRRKKIRRKLKISFFEDYLFRSEVTDYRRLRLLVNSLVGLLICTAIYYMGWKRLNYADFHPTYGVLFQWAMILSVVVAFVLSPLFRCAIFCVMIGALGKNGQAPFTMVIFASLSDGPIDNIVYNCKLTAEIIACNVRMQARITSNKISTLVGPLEDQLKVQLDKGIVLLHKAAKLVRKMIAPFLSEMKAQRTKEDEIMDDKEQQLRILAQRRALGVENEFDDTQELEMALMENMTEKPKWATLKTELGKRIGGRLSKRCNEIFTSGIEKCRDLFASVQKQCYDALPLVVNWFVCDKLNMEHACQDVDRRRESWSFCGNMLSKSHLDPSMEGDIVEVANMTEQLDNEAKTALHLALVEEPRNEMEYTAADLKVMIKAGLITVKGILRSIKQLIQALFIYFVYKVFRKAVEMITSYRNNIEFNNIYLTRLFWQIDEFRKEHQQMALLRVDRTEMKAYRLRKVWSPPTKEELKAAKHPFYKWVLTLLIASIVITTDYYVYSFLNTVMSPDQTVTEKPEKGRFSVIGKGIVANFMNEMLGSNSTSETDEMLTNEHCMIPPRAPDYTSYVLWIVLPLIISLLLQVIFSFLIKRFIMNYFLPYMFPLRDRTRVIYLYNKILYLRATHRKESRARIRFNVERMKINSEYDEGGWLCTRSWIKLQVLDRIFRTGQCLLCQVYMRPKSLQFCTNCPATYCKYCLEEMENNCYACQVENQEVDSENSQTSGVTDTSTFVDNASKAEM